ncbi:uncharacterized protein LOC135201512 [Macrobrachium nipponense]|uniref:uncharacterized protein LOC135201512 n=1 Tax=Macrobrachium nipponense TaxID=159736 RepID=UPI0030C7CBB0
MVFTKGLLFLVVVTIAVSVPLNDPVIDSPETRLWNSLSQSEQQAVVKLAFSLGVNDPLRPDLKRSKRSNSKLDSYEVQDLAEQLLLYSTRKWELTPEQIREISETGKLCNERGFCIDFGGDWGHGCCPFG